MMKIKKSGGKAMKMEELVSSEASPALGPYCHGRKMGNIIITSGQIPLTKDGKFIYEIKEATKLVLHNLVSIVEAGGGKKEDVARVDVYLKTLDDFDAFNEAYAEFFGTHKPTRVCTQAARIAGDVPLEASMIALVEE